jgi:hypothetical protein
MPAPQTGHLVLDTIASSNLPQHKKQGIRAWYDQVVSTVRDPMMAKAAGHAREGVQIVRQGAESALTGATLKLLERKLHGLDVGANKDIPLDGLLSLLGYATAMVMANDPMGLSNDARNVASTALGVMCYRKDVFAKLTGKTVSTAHGDVDRSDPIASAALGLV